MTTYFEGFLYLLRNLRHWFDLFVPD